MANAEIPTIDIGLARAGTLAARRALGQTIARTCESVGFFQIAGHGCPPALIADILKASYRFFDSRLAEKEASRSPIQGAPRGWRRLGEEALGASYGTGVGAPDLKEFYHVGPVAVPDTAYYTGAIGRSYFLPNIWPAHLPEFRPTVERYYRELERIAGALMRLFALGLDLDETFFDDKIDRHCTALRINHYPAGLAPATAGQIRAGAHTDWGTLTILLGEDKPGGLEVLTRSDTWVPVKTGLETFVINIGDLMMRWTNDRWVSNLHRVGNPPADARGPTRRVSIGFFHQPNYDAEIACLPSCRGSGGSAKYAPITSGAYRDLKYRQAREGAG